MSHPRREQWMEYVYGELDPPQQVQIEQHLQDCAECQRALCSWRATMTELDRWVVREAAGRPAFLLRALPWAAAAVVMLAVGYGVGRLSVPAAADAAALKAELEPSIRQAVVQEVEAKWQARLTAAQDQLRREMDEAASATLEAAASATSHLLTQYARTLENVRRSDLLAMASLTERELWRTKWQFANALASTWDGTPGSAETNTSYSNQ